MHITTENEGLLELLERGSSKKKELRGLSKSAINGFLKAIGIFRTAKRIEDLYLYKGLHYERLSGKLKAYESVRCDKKYRLIFRSSTKDENGSEINSIIIDKIDLIKISDHYGDL